MPCEIWHKRIFGVVGTMDYFQLNRKKMVVEQLEQRGISDALVLQAMRNVPRHLYVDEALQAQAYSDHALPIGYGQTITKPFIVALMSQLLRAKQGMKVLEIGTGSGYQASVLAEMGLHVYSVERIEELHLRSKELLTLLQYDTIHMKLDDGTLGWQEYAPFDRIIVSAGGPEIPLPLIEQLSPTGVMLIPVGASKKEQELVRIRKENGRLLQKNCGPVSFVDLVGNHGW